MSTVTRRLSIALAISVAINLFVAGFLVSRAVRPHHAPPAPVGAEFGPFFGPRGLLRRGAGPHAEPAAREVMKRHRAELEGHRNELRAQRRAVEAALRAEPFDAAALERAFAALRTSTAASQERMHAAVVELARSLPAEERRQLARHPMHHGPPGGP